MKTFLFLLAIGSVRFVDAQTLDSLDHPKRKLLNESLRSNSLLPCSRYFFSSAETGKSKPFPTSNTGNRKVQLYANPTYLHRNAFPVHPSAAETIFGAAAKITAQVLVPNARFK